MHGGRLSDSNVVARKVMDLQRIFVASPEYIAKTGRPATLEELAKFPFVCFRWPSGDIDKEWEISNQVVKVEPSIVSDSIGFVKGASARHRGIALLPQLIVRQELKEGTLVNLFPNETFQKGQPIAQLDPHDYQFALEELQARALEAKSAHKLAKAELARVKQAIADNAIANVNLDRAISGYERSEAAVKVVEQNIRRAQDSVRYTRLLTPFDGVIASSNFDQYEQVLPGVAVFTIHKPEQLEVTIDVPENLIHQFEAEQQATISWYHAKKSITGHATEISTLPQPNKTDLFCDLSFG